MDAKLKGRELSFSPTVKKEIRAPGNWGGVQRELKKSGGWEGSPGTRGKFVERSK